jgi:hypothetical protein
MDMNELVSVLSDLMGRFQKAGVDFHFTGGIVAGVYGEMRFTQDVDLIMVVRGLEQRTALLEAFGEDYFVDEELFNEAMETNGMAQAMHLESGARIDLHVGEGVPGELGRTTQVYFLGELLIPAPTREDFLLSKLLWIQLGSHRSKRDAVAVLRNTVPTDLSLVERMATELGVLEILREVETLARSESTLRP